GLTVARRLMRDEAATRVVVLSMFTDHERVTQALEAGVRGYVGKEQPASQILEAVRNVAEGRGYLSPAVARPVIDDYVRLRKGTASSSPLAPLTARERQVFDLTVGGLSVDAMAGQLGVSRRTVETHRSRILH